jgi:hypothetical protein
MSNDTKHLSLAYAESERLVRIAQKRAENPVFKLGVGDYLRQQYQQGIETGGAQGSALCAGVLRAAEELGVSPHDILDPLRTDEQRQAFDDARRLEHYSTLISTSVPEPPKNLQATKQRGSDFSYRSSNILAGPTHKSAPVAKGPNLGGRRKKKAAWK